MAEPRSAFAREIPASDFEQPRVKTDEEISAERELTREAAAGLESMHRLHQQEAWQIFLVLMAERQAAAIAAITLPAEPHVLAHLSGQLAAYQQVLSWFPEQTTRFKQVLTGEENET